MFEMIPTMATGKDQKMTSATTMLMVTAARTKRSGPLNFKVGPDDFSWVHSCITRSHAEDFMMGKALVGSLGFAEAVEFDKYCTCLLRITGVVLGLLGCQ